MAQRPRPLLVKDSRVMARAARGGRPPRIADVAREAGVSTATVSFVLAGKTPVAPATRERVLEVIARLGYRRNSHARALRTGAAPTVSVVVPDLTNPYYAEMVAAIEDAAAEAGWIVTLMNYRLDGGREAAYLGRVFDDPTDGILYFPYGNSARDAVEPRIAGGPPMVFIDSNTRHEHADTVDADNAEAVRLVARHFKERGRHRVLLTGPPREHPTSILRTAAFSAAAADVGLEVAGQTFGALRTFDAVDDTLRLLRDDRSIDALFAGNDLLAIAVYSELRRNGIRVPEDVAICGFDGILLAELFSPRFTTIQQPIRQMGRQAFDFVTNPSPTPRSATLPVGLFVGETT